MTDDYTDKASAKDLARFERSSPGNAARVRAAEKALKSVEEDIMGDMVAVEILCPITGFPTGKMRTVPLNQALSAVMTVQRNLQAESEQSAEDMDENSDIEPLIRLGQQIEEQQADPVPSTPVPMDAAPIATPPAPAPTAIPSAILPGLEFLTTPPSQPTKTVKLQLSGPMKFTTAMSCHATAINDQLVVLVVDNRVKSEIIDILLEDTSIEATLIFEDEEKIDIHPPIPIVMTYDIGVLRHFVFIRKHSGQ